MVTSKHARRHSGLSTATGRWVRVAAVAVSVGLVVAGLTLALTSHQRTGDPAVRSSSSAAATGSLADEGYTLVTITVTPPTGPPRTWHVWQADTTAKIEHGLMGVADLGGYAGMLFEFARPVAFAFWMRNTRIPLSVAFFDVGGAMQPHTVDMTPCGDSDRCSRYQASGPYLSALEAPQGTLPALGLVTGSRITVSAP